MNDAERFKELFDSTGVNFEIVYSDFGAGSAIKVYQEYGKDVHMITFAFDELGKFEMVFMNKIEFLPNDLASRLRRAGSDDRHAQKLLLQAAEALDLLFEQVEELDLECERLQGVNHLMQQRLVELGGE